MSLNTREKEVLTTAGFAALGGAFCILLFSGHYVLAAAVLIVGGFAALGAASD